METNLKLVFRQILDLMKTKVVTNLEELKTYEIEVRDILNHRIGFEKENEIKSKQQLSRLLLAENNDYLELQLKIVNLVNKYYSSEFMNNSLEELVTIGAKKAGYYTETINGRILFNEHHPYFFDSCFIDNLIEHYLTKENYEECERLKAILEKINPK